VNFYLLYNHFDHLLDELAHAHKTRGEVHAYVKIHDQWTRKGEQVTINTAILVTWVQLTERIIHAANIPVETLPLAADTSIQERQVAEVRRRARFARKLVIGALRERGVEPDPNLVLLTEGLREELMQLMTEQLCWKIVVSGSGLGAERQIVVVD
jgi:hypothetical protein